LDGVASPPKVAACGPFQAIYVSPPLKQDVLLAGNFHVNLSVTSTLPDGNFAAYLFHTTGSGACPDVGAKEVRRALTDLRHRTPGAKGADFPVNAVTPVDMRSHPFSVPIKAGERLVLVVGGGSGELTPEARLPVLTVSTGNALQGQITLPVVEGTLAFG
jgi:predicted acyl esterase